MTLIYFVLIFGVIITIHELGHLIAAKAFNVYCHEFSFGMGPKLIGKKYKETQYNIRMFPIGGFVAMAGEADATFDQENIPIERTIKGISKWKQIIVMLAGVFMNFVLALLLFIGLNLIVGQIQEPTQPIVSAVVANSAADKAGLVAGDEIIEVIYPKGDKIYPKEFSEIGTFFELFPEEEITFVVNRGGSQVDVKIIPELDAESGRYLIGIQGLAGEIIDLTFIGAVKAGFNDFVNGGSLILKSLTFLVRGIGVDKVSGPIGILDQTGQIMGQATSIKDGSLIIMNLIAILSVNLGIFNLIPLPMFDGGRVVLTLYEIVFRRDVNKKVENALMLASLFILVMLVVFTTWNDISRLIFR